MKLFTFNASSFPLDPSIENFLKSKGAIVFDFGTAAYINSEMMPLVLSELIENDKIVADSNTDFSRLNEEMAKLSIEKQKMTEDNAKLISKFHSCSLEAASLKDQVTGALTLIGTLKTENLRLQHALKLLSSQNGKKVNESYEKLQKEYTEMRAQRAEALASVKILEEENEELVREVDRLRNQFNNPPPPKVA